MPPKPLAMVATSRSGHHAVMNWLMAQMGDVWELGPMWHHDMALRQWDGKRLVDRVKTKDPDILPPQDAGWFIRAYENATVGKVRRCSEGPVVLVIRDLKNWLASLWRWTHTRDFKWDEKSSHTIMAIWKEHAVWALLAKDPQVIIITYPDWVRYITYRASTAQILGLPSEKFEQGEKTKQTVATAGGGSSFDYRATAAEDLDVFNRWDEIERRDTLEELLRLHPDAVMLDKELFG